MLISQGIFIDASHAAIPLTHDCESGIAGSLSEFFTCGSVSGDLRTLYYSTHNAYFVSGLSQDTVSYGGGVKYATAEYYGVSLGVSGILQRGISHNDDHLVNELGPNQTGVGEAGSAGIMTSSASPPATSGLIFLYRRLRLAHYANTFPGD